MNNSQNSRRFWKSEGPHIPNIPKSSGSMEVGTDERPGDNSPIIRTSIEHLSPALSGRRHKQTLHKKPAVVRETPIDGSDVEFQSLVSKINLLPKSYFLKQLRLEKRRAERFKAPLSMALFWLGDEKKGEFGDFKEFLQLLRSRTRETDIVGYLGEDVIGMLLPDTNEKGMQKFTKKIVNDYKNPPFTVITGTYPDQLFENLLTENPNPPDFYPFFLDDLTEANRSGYLLKRSLDIVGSLGGILLLSPVILVTALAIKLTSPGPVIFRQIRLGKNGIPFVFYKFRSMYSDTDDRIHREYVTKLIQGNLEEINQGDREKPVYKMKSDSRVTPVGRIIRKTSIDELPQFFNVLKGEMSLVGPRPPLPYEADKYQSWHLRRVLEMKPGITGLWQVGGRSETSFDDMVRLDIQYIRNCSLMLDLKILIKTVKRVLRSTGAF